MKRIGWLFLVLLMAAPAWSATKKVTAQELKDMLTQMQQDKKSDDAVSLELKQVEVTEQLTPAFLNSLGPLVPGQQSLAQVYILEARSAMLPPPPSDIPHDPAPDAAAQKAILDKTTDYVSKTYAQLPDVTATKTTIRFQDNMETVAASSGLHGSAQDASTNNGLNESATYYRFLGTADTSIASDHGVEKMPTEKDKTPWGANKMIALEEQGPVLSNDLNEAQAAGKISFLRWETVNGKAAAVFSFTVEKKKSRYAVNYCCFPDTDQAGVANFQSAALGGARGTGGGGATGNFQTNTSWKNFKATVPYHGEIFINPDSGIVVRLIHEADFKTSEVVHQEDTRIDYGPVTIGDKTLVLPVKEIVDTEVVPNGEDAAGKFALRHTLFYTEYKNYQLAGAAH